MNKLTGKIHICIYISSLNKIFHLQTAIFIFPAVFMQMIKMPIPEQSKYI